MKIQIQKPAFMPGGFYVYLHRKATTREVFYVGKGTGRRAIKQERNQHWNAIAKKHGVIVEIVESDLQEWAAFEMEADLISLYGRIDCGSGTLVNMTDGGDGASGCVCSESKKAKLRDFQKGRKKSPEHIANVKAALARPDVRARRGASISAGLKGKAFGDERKASLREASARTRAKRVAAIRLSVARSVECIETGVIFPAITDAMTWLRSTGRSASSQGKITMACDGKRNTAFGYKWRFAHNEP